MTGAEAAKAMGFAHFTGAMEGEDTWVVVGAIWGVERSANDTATTIKTAEGPLMVMESPDQVFERLFETLANDA